MIKTIYKNPLSKVYQYEYAVYVILSSYFRSVKCNSNTIKTLKMYYSELVKTTAKGNFSYEDQYLIEEESEDLILHAILGNIRMPHMSKRDARVIISTNEDGTHSFTFLSEEYSFTYRFIFEEVNPQNKKEDGPKKIKFALKVMWTDKSFNTVI